MGTMGTRSSAFVVALLLAEGVGAAAQQPAGATGGSGGQATRAAPAVDPAAVAALERMGAFLRQQRRFEIKGQTLTDDVLESGQKVQLSASVDLKVRRPDRLRAEMQSDRKSRQLYYDGKTFTVYGPRSRYYARVAAPATIRELIEVAARRYGIELPLADLFYWGTERSGVSDLRAAVALGPSTIDGAKTEHYAFRQAGADWQIWIQQGDQPLPRKLIVTNTREPSQPQHQVLLDWSLNPTFDDRLFAFTPPPGALPIALDEVQPMVPRARQGRTVRPGRGGPP
jgi:hypothetical protein